MSKISPCLWFDGKAEEAARLYVSILPDSRIDAVVKSAVDTPGGKAGSVMLVEFTLAGQTYLALNGGPIFQFNEAISFAVNCADQTEVDRVWDALVADGGKPVQCGCPITGRARVLRIRSNIIQDSNSVVVAVEDSGTGIDKREKDRIFEPFFTTKSTGLGIGTCHLSVYH